MGVRQYAKNSGIYIKLNIISTKYWGSVTSEQHFSTLMTDGNISGLLAQSSSDNDNNMFLTNNCSRVAK